MWLDVCVFQAMFTVVRVLCRASSRQVRGGSSFRRVVAAAGEKRVLLALSPAPSEFAGCEVRQLATHAQIPPALEYEDNKVKCADYTHCRCQTNFNSAHSLSASTKISVLAGIIQLENFSCSLLTRNY